MVIGNDGLPQAVRHECMPKDSIDRVGRARATVMNSASGAGGGAVKGKEKSIAKIVSANRMQICDRGNWVDDMVSFQKVYCRARTQRQCTSLRTSDTCKVFLTTQNEPNEVTAVRGLGYHGI